MSKDISAQSLQSKAVQDALDGKSKGFKRLLPFLGPAFIAAIAYIDPGNFATNISAGSKYGYMRIYPYFEPAEIFVAKFPGSM